MSLRVKPFKKNQHGYPTHELDGTVGYPVDHAIEGENAKSKPHGNAPMSHVSHQPGKPFDTEGPGAPTHKGMGGY